MKKYFNSIVGVLVVIVMFLSGMMVGRNMSPAKYCLYTNNHHSIFKALDSIGIEYTPEQKTAVCKFLKEDKRQNP